MQLTFKDFRPETKKGTSIVGEQGSTLMDELNGTEWWTEDIVLATVSGQGPE